MKNAPLMLLFALFVAITGYSQTNLNSLPSAAATIYLDFDGENVNSAYWNGGNAFTCLPAALNDGQITEIFNRVSEDFRPFDINITTSLATFMAAPLSHRIRVIITPTSNWFTGAGGVSLTGSFVWGDDTPAFVFCDRLGPNSPKMVAECCSHESGHALGLSHQSKYDGICNLTATYNEGEGTGINAWAPIMGNSYYRNMSGWNNGPTPYGCTNTQDNISIITSYNGFSFRADDYTDDINSSATVFKIANDKMDGVITTNTDKDVFTFSLARNSGIHLNVKPFSINDRYDGANLDIKLSLYNSAKQLIRVYDPAATMNVEIDTILSTGTYYLLLDGTGNTNVNDYGSLGSYSIAGSVTGTLPISDVSLAGKNDQNKHHLNWNIISDEPISSVTVESSADGIHFTNLNEPGANSNNLVYTPFRNNDIYYRVKVKSLMNQLVYSNTILLKGVNKAQKLFNVSTFINSEITVHAGDNYQYMVSDINGNMLGRGNGIAGFNRLNMSRYPSGMYVLQLLSNNEKQTERIIKL